MERTELMPRMPRDSLLDSTLALYQDPYRFIMQRCRRFGSDLFEARLLLGKTICMTGPAAARLFYDADRFMRLGAMPEPIMSTLIGHGGVQGLDDEAHRHRKHIFLSLMLPGRFEGLLERLAAQWNASIEDWAKQQEVTLYFGLHDLLARGVCAWVGVPLEGRDAPMRIREIVALFDHAGSAGIRHLWSRFSRKRAERWMAGIVADIRSGTLRPPEESIVCAIARHRDLDGQLLPPRVAAVELLNVIRPVVAVSVYILFIAHALHENPVVRETLRSAAPEYKDAFVQEVRRYYPFFPAVAARARHAFKWRGYRFPAGRRVILDLHGTNHDPRTWERPDDFEPARFLQSDGDLFNLIPQGGGHHASGHRCAGEWITLAIMKQGLDMLVHRIRYDVPEQDLRIDWSRLPALPRSRFVVRNVRPA
ncbi:MAG TPA: cytochrome P450 [Pedomonas sp.]|uniref:cytochrome P450 n=1 Tax=Pedomonas sp. TaxID=2976421 RepID=UPI002F4040CF